MRLVIAASPVVPDEVVPRPSGRVPFVWDGVAKIAAVQKGDDDKRKYQQVRVSVGCRPLKHIRLAMEAWRKMTEQLILLKRP